MSKITRLVFITPEEKDYQKGNWWDNNKDIREFMKKLKEKRK